MDNFTFEKTKVYLNDLDDDMTILAYIGFSKKYHQLTKQTCAFLKSNFKGTHAVVERNGKHCSLQIDHLKEDDYLYQIDSFPSSLNQLTQVNDQLKRTLRTHGMLRFEVMRPVKLKLDNQNDLIYLINLAKNNTLSQP